MNKRALRRKRLQAGKRMGNLLLALIGTLCVFIVIVGLLQEPRHPSPSPAESKAEQLSTAQPSSTVPGNQEGSATGSSPAVSPPAGGFDERPPSSSNSSPEGEGRGKDELAV
jgi:hypothetical protein